MLHISGIGRAGVQLKEEEERIEVDEAETRKRIKVTREHHKKWEETRETRVPPHRLPPPLPPVVASVRRHDQSCARERGSTDMPMWPVCMHGC